MVTTAMFTKSWQIKMVAKSNRGFFSKSIIFLWFASSALRKVPNCSDFNEKNATSDAEIIADTTSRIKIAKKLKT